MKKVERVHDVEEYGLLSESRFRDQLINHMVILWAGLGMISFLLVQSQTAGAGWAAQDVMRFLLLVCILGVALFRNKISTACKAVSLMVFNLIVGIVGTYVLGVFAGAVFFFPLVALVLTLFSSVRTAAAFALLSLLYVGYVAFGFSTGQISLGVSAEHLLASYENWSIYIISIAFFYLVTCTTVLNYRQAMSHLITSLQEKNEELQDALDEIKTLKGILPLCSFCKRVRSDNGQWMPIDMYIKQYSDADISHSVCPTCLQEHYSQEHLAMKQSVDAAV